MTSRDLGFVSLRLTAVYLIISGFDYLRVAVEFWSFFQNNDMATKSIQPLYKSWMMVYLLSALFLFGLSHFVFVNTGKILRYAISPPQEPGEEGQESKNRVENVQAAAFSIVGLIFFSGCVLGLFFWIRALLINPHYPPDFLNFGAVPLANTPINVINLLEYLGGIVISLALIIGSGKFSRFISSTNTGAKSLTQWVARHRISQLNREGGAK
jgi:hypothetical protein